MSQIFDTNNQMIIRFPEDIAEQLNQFFENGGDQPQVTIESDPSRTDTVGRIALQVGVNGQKYKATVMDLPTISSTFKTIDRVNFFKSNDISQIIEVHESQYDVINQSDAYPIYSKNHPQKVERYKSESGLNDCTANIRQRFFRKRPDVEHKVVEKVDRDLDSIKGQFTKQDEKGGRKNNKRLQNQ